MTKQEWIEEALKVLIENTGGEWHHRLERQFAEGLYDTYVEDRLYTHECRAVKDCGRGNRMEGLQI